MTLLDNTLQVADKALALGGIETDRCTTMARWADGCSLNEQRIAIAIHIHILNEKIVAARFALEP